MLSFRAGLFFVLICGTCFAPAADEVDLINPKAPLGGWSFDNGQEFPGAVGKLELDEKNDEPTLKLSGNFDNGGNYVQCARKLGDVSIDSVDFDIKVPAGCGQVTTRLVDGAGHCHQLKIRLNDKGGWQHYHFPVKRYFDAVQAGAPLDIVTQYQSWGNGQAGHWSQPAKLFVVLAGREQMTDGSISLRNVVLTPTPPTVELPTTVRLDTIGDDDTGSWEYNNGNEFKGARGGLDGLKGSTSSRLKLSADFSEGGAYVGMRTALPRDNVGTTKAIRWRVRSTSVSSFSLRLVDETDQCHQRGGLAIEPDGRWHEIVIDPLKIAGGEHWGGANDGHWHGAARLIEIMLSTRSSDGGPMTMELSDIAMDTVVEAEEASMSWKDDFEATSALAAWNLEGDAEVVAEGNGHAVRLARDIDHINDPTSMTGPMSRVNRGTWMLRYRYRSDLESRDNSFHGETKLLVANAAGEVIDTVSLGIGFGKTEWTNNEQTVTLPAEAASARIQTELHKAYGQFFVDDFSIARLSVQPAEPTIENIKIASSATGNLFYPGEAVAFHLNVATFKPLAAEDQSISYRVLDYRGDEQFAGGPVALEPASGVDRQYEAAIELPVDRINLGQFYELHVEVPQGAGSPVTEFSGFAMLPEAASKQYEPKQIPFTIRNWDGRIGDYFYLADRLGLRQIGLWGGWSSEPPYKPHLPGIDTIRKLDAGWITGTPASSVERDGFGKVTEEMLRQGMTNFLQEFADDRLMMICQGNEPHGTGQKVLDNIKAYKANYEAVKAFNARIEVVGTSVEPNDEYFRNGYQNYLDSYDFHVYEHYTNVRLAMQQYKELMQKYDAVKPIHSTELGLNSQGQARLAVAIELIKKCTVFFAEGGETVSWFTIMYPDTKGKARGGFGDAHCVFDCKFNNYNPRLDAIAHYNIINAMLDKRFVGEQQHEDGTQAFLFQNQKGQCLQILWNDVVPTTRAIKVPSGVAAEIIQIDGRRSSLKSEAGKVNVDVSVEPVFVTYSEK